MLPTLSMSMSASGIFLIALFLGQCQHRVGASLQDSQLLDQEVIGGQTVDATLLSVQSTAGWKQTYTNPAGTDVYVDNASDLVYIARSDRTIDLLEADAGNLQYNFEPSMEYRGDMTLFFDFDQKLDFEGGIVAWSNDTDELPEKRAVSAKDIDNSPLCIFNATREIDKALGSNQSDVAIIQSGAKLFGVNTSLIQGLVWDTELRESPTTLEFDDMGDDNIIAANDNGYLSQIDGFNGEIVFEYKSQSQNAAYTYLGLQSDAPSEQLSGDGVVITTEAGKQPRVEGSYFISKLTKAGYSVDGSCLMLSTVDTPTDDASPMEPPASPDRDSSPPDAPPMAPPPTANEQPQASSESVAHGGLAGHAIAVALITSSVGSIIV